MIRLATEFRTFSLDYEAAALRSFLRLAGPGHVVWDVGANMGIYTLLAGNRVGPSGRIVSWEPSPRTFALLQRHIAANDLGDRCQAIQAAVNDGSAVKVQFAANQPDSSTNRLFTAVRSEDPGLVEVEADSLDSWCRKLGHHPDVVKIDVEGAEVFALA